MLLARDQVLKNRALLGVAQRALCRKRDSEAKNHVVDCTQRAVFLSSGLPTPEKQHAQCLDIVRSEVRRRPEPRQGVVREKPCVKPVGFPPGSARERRVYDVRLTLKGDDDRVVVAPGGFNRESERVSCERSL
jgi:hypothetical protein